MGKFDVKIMQETYKKDSLVWYFQEQKLEADDTEGPAIVVLMLLNVITPQDLQMVIVLKVEVVKSSYNLQ